KPTSERVARELAGLEPEQQREAWQRAVERRGRRSRAVAPGKQKGGRRRGMAVFLKCSRRFAIDSFPTPNARISHPGCSYSSLTRNSVAGSWIRSKSRSSLSVSA